MKFILAAFSCCFLVAGAQNGNYVIVAPKAVRPGFDYTISVASRVPELSLEAKLLKRDGSTLVQSGTKMFQPNDPDVLTLKVPSNEDMAMTYQLVVSGSNRDIRVYKNTTVTVNKKTTAVMIQTDKQLYKPGQEVKMRVFAITPDLLSHAADLELIITDPHDNRIVQKNVMKSELNHGVYSTSFALSDQPVLGAWKIRAKFGDEVGEQTFTADEYVLPNVEVKVTPHDAYFVNGMSGISFDVKADYTYGQPVKGTCKSLVQWKNTYSSSNNQVNKTITAELQDGKCLYFVSRDEMTQLCSHMKYYCPQNDGTAGQNSFATNIEFWINANVTDKNTGKTYSDEAKVIMSTSPYKLEFISSPEVFKNNLTYIGYVKLTDPVGNPVPSLAGFNDQELRAFAKVNITVNMEYSTTISTDTGSKTERGNEQLHMTASFDRSGVAQFSLNIPAPFEKATINARFDTIGDTKSIKAFKSRDQEGIQVTLAGPAGPVQSGESVTIQVRTTAPITSYYYVVLSKGDIVSQDGFTFAAATEHEFQYEVSGPALAPKATMLVYYVTDAGELIADSLVFNVEGMFKNKVSLRFNNDKSLPGEQRTLYIEAEPGSFVGVSAVDLSVQLLGTGNEITVDKIGAALEGFSDAEPSHGGDPCAMGGRCIMNRRKRSLWYWPMPVTGTDAKTLFKNANLLLLTDAFLFVEEPDYVQPPFMWERGIAEMAPAAPDMAPVPAPAPAPAGPSGPNDLDEEKTLAEPSRTRVTFPETWLWIDEILGSDGKTYLETVVPDTLTTWKASAFALSDDVGLGISDSADMLVFQEFFVSWNIPYSIIRGESFAAKAVVYNYFDYSLKTIVTMKKTAGVQFRSGKNDKKITFSIDANGDATQELEIPPQDAATASFWITPTMLGNVDLEVTALAGGKADAVKRPIIVEPEGIETASTKSFLLDVTDGEVNEEFKVEYSDELVPGSERVTCSAVGDLMGPSITGLDKLLQMPFGCGEQNMLNFAPNIYVLQYLEATEQATSAIEAKAKRNMAAGYQRELTYMWPSLGGFSAFGERDDSPSTWLTAFVVKCFQQAQSSNYITIDMEKHKKSLRFLMDKQNSDGSFREDGRVIHTDMQSGTKSGVTLTAYTLIALAENTDVFLNADQTHLKEFQDSRDLAKKYLELELTKMRNDTYALTIIAYALTMEGSDKAQVALEMLEALAVMKDGMKYWRDKTTSDSDMDGVKKMPHYYRESSSKEVEMTSYVLLTYTAQRKITEGLPVLKWLSTQRNSFGGFHSTQDTVLGMQALSWFAELTQSADGGQRVSVSLTGSDDGAFDFDPITSSNGLVMQQVLMASDPGTIRIRGRGTGVALVQCTVQSNVYRLPLPPQIEVEVKSDLVKDNNNVNINVCAKWIPVERGSGMVVMEINQLTEYLADTDALQQLVTDKAVKRFEQDGRKIVIYLDELNNDMMCISLTTVRQQLVENIKGAVVSVYPYYQTELKQNVVYLPEALKMVKELQDGGAGHHRGSAAVLLTSLGLIMAARIGLH